MSFSRLPGPWDLWLPALAAVLDPRSAPRLVRLCLGAILATGRRAVPAWVRAAGLTAEFRPAYTTPAAAGRRAEVLAARAAHEVLKPRLAGADRPLFALDDAPTERYGPKVQGAGAHHNPTPGPAGGPFVYGPSWVVLGWLARHPTWGTVALPLRARLGIRRKDLPGGPERLRPALRTKLELAVGLVRRAPMGLGMLGKPLWVVADGAYANAAFLKPVIAAGGTVVSRLRKNAALSSRPGPRPAGRRGRRRVYGEERISLAKRAGQCRGGPTGTLDLYGRPAAKTYKTFLATWRPAGGAPRVVPVQEPRGWVAFFCTDPAARGADIRGAVADRFRPETAFRDVKQVVGAGQQQVRRLATSSGAFHVCLWTYPRAEAGAWGRPTAGPADRSGSPGDDPDRRPSHADQRRSLRRELLAAELQAALRTGLTAADLTDAAERLLNLAA